MARQIIPLDYGSYTITATAGLLFTFTDTGSPSTPVTTANSFEGVLETASVRARGDGTGPTATEGQLIEIGNKIILSVSDMANMRFIRTGSVSGVLKGHFYNVEADVLIGSGR